MSEVAGWLLGGPRRGAPAEAGGDGCGGADETWLLLTCEIQGYF